MAAPTENGGGPPTAGDAGGGAPAFGGGAYATGGSTGGGTPATGGGASSNAGGTGGGRGDACGGDALSSSCGCGWLPRLVCPGTAFRSSKFQPSVAYARQAVNSIAQQRAKASLRAAAAHNEMSARLADSVAVAAASVAKAAADAAAVASVEDRAAAAALVEARKEALLELVAELGEQRPAAQA